MREEEGVRYLHFGSQLIQGAMRIARPYALELEYTREMMLPLLLRPERRWPRRVLLIGLGTASILKFLYRHRPQAVLQVVEIDPAVIDVARQCFKLPVDPKRIHITVADGYDYLAQTAREFDLIVVDGYDAKGRAGMLDTLPFYLNARTRCSNGAWVVANLLTRARGRPAALAVIEDAFDGAVLSLPRTATGNVIALAGTGAMEVPSVDDLAIPAAALRRETGLNLFPTLLRLGAVRTPG